MRAFVAVVPPPDAVAPLAAAAEQWRQGWPELGWVPPERWHLTLCFLGEVTEETAAAVGDELGALAASASPIPAAMGGGGTFPPRGSPRVVWVGVEASAPLPALAAGVAEVAAGAGLEVDARSYRPHITVARARRQAPHDLAALRSALGVARGRAFTIDRLVLFRSQLGRKPRYEELAAWPLASRTTGL